MKVKKRRPWGACLGSPVHAVLHRVSVRVAVCPPQHGHVRPLTRARAPRWQAWLHWARGGTPQSGLKGLREGRGELELLLYSDTCSCWITAPRRPLLSGVTCLPGGGQWLQGAPESKQVMEPTDEEMTALRDGYYSVLQGKGAPGPVRRQGAGRGGQELLLCFLRERQDEVGEWLWAG